MPAKSKINMPMLMRVMGWLVMIEAVFMLVPLLTAWIYGEDDLRAFAVSAVATAFAGVMNGIRCQAFALRHGQA